MQKSQLYEGNNSLWKQYFFNMTLLWRWATGITLFFFIMTAVFTLLVYSRPVSIDEKVLTNTIREKTTIDYEIDVLPSTLYPNGGMVEPEEAIFPKITKSILFTIHHSITADKPVEVKGLKQVTLC